MSDKEKSYSPSSFSEVGKTALYYEYTSVDVKENHVIEKTLTSLLSDPDVSNENIRKVTYYLVQKFFIKSANDKKEDIDLISQIPGAFKKIVDTASKTETNKNNLIKLFHLYLSHTISMENDLANLFENYITELNEFRQNFISRNNTAIPNSIQDKEAVIEQIYKYMDSINFTIMVKNTTAKDRARKKIDKWISKIFDNHVIENAMDVVMALIEYCHEEVEQSKKGLNFLKKYAKLNLEIISKEITDNPGISTMNDGWPVLTENIFIYIDKLTREHGNYRKFLEEIFSPVDEKFDDYFFSQFFLISAYQKQTEKDIYLLEKTFKDLHLIHNYKSFFTSKIHEKILENVDKSYSIENYFLKSILEIKGLHKNTFVYLTLKYLLEDTLDVILQDKSKKSSFTLYKKAFTDFIRPKFPKFLDNLIFIYLKESKDLQKKVGNTKKSYNDIYKKDIDLLKNVFTELGLTDGFNQSILPCITGLELSNKILKRSP